MFWFYTKSAKSFIHSLQCLHPAAGSAQEQSAFGERCFPGLRLSRNTHSESVQTGSEVRVIKKLHDIINIVYVSS